MKEIFATKENKIRIACFFAGAIVLFFIAPAILNMLPEEQNAVATLVLLMIVNQIFIGVCGWQSNHFGKIGLYVPFVLLLIYTLSEFLRQGTITWTMEMEYLQTGYICYFLNKFITIRRKQEEAKQKKAFPKGVGRK